MSKNNNASWRHHYVPQFYLKRWTTEPDNELWCYRRVPSGKLVEGRVGTKGTGFGEHLYSIQHTFPFSHIEPTDVIEKRFFQEIDDNAAKALWAILDGRGLDESGQHAWAIFICSMLHRGAQELAERDAQAPAMVEEVLNQMRALGKTPESAASMEKTLSRIDTEAMARNSVRQSMIREIEDPKHIEYLKGLQSRVIQVAPDAPLVTSDVPIIVNMGKSERPIEMLTCALSPEHLLVCWNPQYRDLGNDEEFHKTAGLAALLHNCMQCEGRARYLYAREKLQDTPQVRLRTAAETRFGLPPNERPAPAK